jgi:hypothetical protein
VENLKVTDPTNPERQRTSRERRARAYMVVKAIAQRTGHMAHERDVDGLDHFLDEFAIDGREINWYEAISDI